ncbi:MAG: molybdopterin-dependent oxidoreductase [Desulfotignum sp.]|nr:molybdopterin-dependent oxidoreductase [Desulfotignum sp.]
MNWIQGNPHVAGIDGRLCPRGSAGKSLLYDDQRLQSPLIRVGDRGSGNWRKASWEEALDYVGTRLKEIKDTHGGHAIALGERAQLATHVSKTFLKALGSPNHFTHDALCKGSMNTACRSMFGYTDGQMGINYANTKHIVLYGRNIFESINVKEGKYPYGCPGKRGKAHLYRSQGECHGVQGPPVLDDPAGHRPGPQLRPDPCHFKRTPL